MKCKCRFTELPLLPVRLGPIEVNRRYLPQRVGQRWFAQLSTKGRLTLPFYQLSTLTAFCHD
jgi:hypothetical protein